MTALPSGASGAGQPCYGRVPQAARAGLRPPVCRREHTYTNPAPLCPQYYDLPSLSLRGAAWRQMQAGLTGFRVDKVARPQGVKVMAGFRAAAEPATWRNYVYRDT